MNMTGKQLTEMVNNSRIPRERAIKQTLKVLDQSCLIYNTCITDGLQSTFLEGRATVREVIFWTTGNYAYCRVEFNNEPGEKYTRYVEFPVSSLK